MDGGSDVEWEETVVFVELNGVPGDQLFPTDQDNINAKILGLGNHNPIMEINGHTFSGHYEDMLGTSLFLERQQKKQKIGGGDSSKANAQDVAFEYFCKAEKKLVMQPALVLEKPVEKTAQPAPETTNTDAAEPETSVQLANDAAEPETSVQLANDAAEPETSVQLANDAAEPETSVQLANDAAEPETSVQLTNDAAEPETSLQNERSFVASNPNSES